MESRLHSFCSSHYQRGLQHQDQDLCLLLCHVLHVDQYRLSHSQVYLSDEEIKELHALLDNFIKDKRDKDRKDKSEYQKCRFYNFFYPEI